MTITVRPSRLIGVAERCGFISCSMTPLSIDQLPPWGGNNLQAIRKLIRDCQKSDGLSSMLFNSEREIITRMRQSGIPSIEASIYYVGRSYKKHGWRHSILTAI